MNIDPVSIAAETGFPFKSPTCTTGTLDWWPYSGYTWYNWPIVSASQEAEKLIAVYRKEFGKDWKRMYEKTVRLELK